MIYRFALLLLLLPLLALSQPRETRQPQCFQLTIYHYHDSIQEATIESYLERALLPALKRSKLPPVGVFKAISNDTAKLKTLYLLVSYASMKQADEVEKGLQKDRQWLRDGTAYLDAGAKSAPYDRMEIITLQAFAMAPTLQASDLKGPLGDRVYELRSYESATEKIGRNKIRMFNEGGEIALFDRLGFDACFYGKVSSGPKMPNLMYLTRFDNRSSRDAHWKAFGEDAEWKKLSALPEYKDNVSHIDISFLRPTSYSGL